MKYMLKKLKCLCKSLVHEFKSLPANNSVPYFFYKEHVLFEKDRLCKLLRLHFMLRGLFIYLFLYVNKVGEFPCETCVCLFYY